VSTLKRLVGIGSVFFALTSIYSCGFVYMESPVQMTYGTPLNMGAPELQYSVIVLDNQFGCTGTAIGPRHVITASKCLGRFYESKSVEVISFSGPRPVTHKVVKAIRHPYEKVASQLPNSSSVLGSDIALLLVEKPMTTSGITIARPEQNLQEPLKLTGFGRDENDQTNGLPRNIRSAAGWKSASAGNGYGIIGFLKGDGLPCWGDEGAPSVSGGLLVGIVSNVWIAQNRGPSLKCSDVENAVLTDVRLMRGWLKCSSAQLDAPLDQVKDAIDDARCAKNEILDF
jgi:hypothetical protein